MKEKLSIKKVLLAMHWLRRVVILKLRSIMKKVSPIQFAHLYFVLIVCVLSKLEWATMLPVLPKEHFLFLLHQTVKHHRKNDVLIIFLVAAVYLFFY